MKLSHSSLIQAISLEKSIQQEINQKKSFFIVGLIFQMVNWSYLLKWDATKISSNGHSPKDCDWSIIIGLVLITLLMNRSHLPNLPIIRECFVFELIFTIKTKGTIIQSLQSLTNLVQGLGKGISDVRFVYPLTSSPITKPSNRVSPGGDGLPDLVVLHTRLDFCCGV